MVSGSLRVQISAASGARKPPVEEAQLSPILYADAKALPERPEEDLTDGERLSELETEAKAWLLTQPVRTAFSDRKGESHAPGEAGAEFLARTARGRRLRGAQQRRRVAHVQLPSVAAQRIVRGSAECQSADPALLYQLNNRGREPR